MFANIFNRFSMLWVTALPVHF